jgi:hypothetical protein
MSYDLTRRNFRLQFYKVVKHFFNLNTSYTGKNINMFKIRYLNIKKCALTLYTSSKQAAL